MKPCMDSKERQPIPFNQLKCKFNDIPRGDDRRNMIKLNDVHWFVN